MKKTVIVTGGAGFLGSHLIRALAAKGYDVQVIDSLVNGKGENVPFNINLINEDIRNREMMFEVFEKIAQQSGGIHGVFHLAALPRVQFSIDHYQEAFSVNVQGLENIFAAAKAAGARRLIYSASSSAYGNAETLPLSESMPASPMSPYAAQKYYGELVARNYALHYGLETVSLRYFNIIGPGADPKGAYAQAVIKFIDATARGQKMVIFGDGEQSRDSVYVEDVVRANILALESPRVGRGEVINIGSGRNETIRNIATLIGGQNYEFGPARIEPRKTQADIRLARELLGWEPEVTLEKAIRIIQEGYKPV